MRHVNLLNAADAVLVIVDLQENFRPVIFEFDRIVARTVMVIEAAKLLEVPILVSEQVPEKLGATVDEIKRPLPPSATVISKTAFSACGAQALGPSLQSLKRRQVLLCGIESHVCMNQTAHDLLSLGYQVHLLTDCTSSRTPENRGVGIEKMIASGAIRSSSEMAVFELMRDAKHEQFRAVSKLVK
jgi:nicotinamidase-related amidase